MMYAISQGREDEYHVWYGTDMVCSSPNWRDIINFLKAMYKQNGYNPLHIVPINIPDRAKLVGLEVLAVKMHKKMIA